MSLFSAVGRLVRPISRAVSSPVGRVIGNVAKAVPGVGTVLGAVGAAGAVYDVGKAVFGSSGSSNSGLPALPVGGASPMNGPGGGIIAPGQTGGFGLPRGPGGKLQLPWNDPSIAAQLKPFALDDSYLRPYLRAPKGYVVMRDPQGRPFAVLKSEAKRYGWRPHKKPPISVGEYQSLKRAKRAIHKVQKIHGLISYVSTHTTDSGKVKIHRKKGSHK